MNISNFAISDFINTLNIASRGHFKSINVIRCRINIKIIQLLYKNGIISNFYFDKISKKIRIFFKFYQNRYFYFQLQLISKPSKRVY